MEVSGKRQQGDGTDQRKGILCDLCNEENEEEPAVSFCTVCNEYLCEADTKAHRKAKVLKDHILLDGDEMPHQKLKALEDNTCSTHSGKQIEYYCKPHSKWCCTLCATAEHRECDIAYIDDMAKGYELGEEYSSLVKAFKDQTKYLENTQKEAAKKKKYVQLNHEKLILEVKKFRVELNAALDFLESATLKEFQLLSDCNIQLADSVSAKCETILSDIHDISSYVESLKKYNQSRQLVIQSKKAYAQIGECERKVAELSHQNTIQEYTFSPNDVILQSLTKVNTLGQFPSMKDRYWPNGINQEAYGKSRANCGQSDKGLSVADQDKDNKCTTIAENTTKERMGQLVTEPADITVQPEKKSRDNSPKSITSSDDSRLIATTTKI